MKMSNHMLKVLNKKINLSVNATLRRFKKKGVTMLVPGKPESDIAYTDGTKIIINKNSSFFDGFAEEDRIPAVYGLACHEMCHVMWTDFSHNLKLQELIKLNSWMNASEEFINTVINSLETNRQKKIFLSVFHELENRLEDGHIEYRYIKEETNPMFLDGLYCIREKQYNDMMAEPDDEIKEKLEKASEVVQAYIKMSDALLCYAKYKHFGLAADDEFVDKMIPLIKIIDRYRKQRGWEDRLTAVNEVILGLWDIIYPYIKELEETTPDTGESSDGGDATTDSASGRTISTSTSTPADSSTGEVGDDVEGAKDGSPSGDDDTSVSAPEAEDEKELAPRSEEEKAEAKARAAIAMEKLLKEASKEEEIEKKEAAIKAEAEAEAKATTSVTTSVERIKADAVSETTYDVVGKELEAIAKRAAKILKQKLQDYRRGGRQKNLHHGKIMDMQALIRKDGKCFARNKLPQQEPRMVVGVLVDESGSMSGSRIEAARATAIILYNFCQELGIPCTIVGHSGDQKGSRTLELYDYVEFDSVDGKDKYRLMDISARCQNRDIEALKYMYAKMKKRPETTKLLFVISDGAPCAGGYGGSKDIEDIKTLVAKEKRVKTFAAAIGSDKPQIEDMYGDGYMDITDLNKLPTILTKKILSYIKI